MVGKVGLPPLVRQHSSVNGELLALDQSLLKFVAQLGIGLRPTRSLTKISFRLVSQPISLLSENSSFGRIIMRTFRSLLAVLCVALLVAMATAISTAQEQTSAPTSTKLVELTPATSDISVGQKVKFTAVVKDASGNKTNAPASAWFAAPFDLAGVDESGTVSFVSPGEVLVGAIVGGKTVLTRVMVKPGPVTRIDVEPPPAPLVVGASTKLVAVARDAQGNPRSDVEIKWTVAGEAVTVDQAGVLTALVPGNSTIVASADKAMSNPFRVYVVKNSLQGLSIEPRSTNARTGDVVRFNVHAKNRKADNSAVRWTVSGPAATIDSDGGFVAELPGSYVITTASGPQEAVASVVVTPRNAERTLEVVGRAPIKDFEAAEQWIIGNYAYLSTISDKLLVYDISDPAHPKQTD